MIGMKQGARRYLIFRNINTMKTIAGMRRISSNSNFKMIPKTSIKRINKSSFYWVSEKGCISIKPLKPNQDRYFYHQISKENSIMGVFDGHGKYGHQVAEFVKEFFSEFAKDSTVIDSDTIKNSFATWVFRLQENFCEVRLNLIFLELPKSWPRRQMFTC